MDLDDKVRRYDENTEYDVAGYAVNLWTEDGTMVNTEWLEQVYWRKGYSQGQHNTLSVSAYCDERFSATRTYSEHISLMHEGKEMKARWPCPNFIMTQFIQV